MRKNSFLVFLSALLPGAGQMYHGFAKRGVSLMTMFFGVIAVAAFFHMGFLCLLLPIIWFYAFFDTFNIANMQAQSRMTMEDDYLLVSGDIIRRFLNWGTNKRHVLVGTIIIFAGSYLIINNLLRPFLFAYFDFDSSVFRVLDRAFDSIPSIAIAVAIIIFGVLLVKGNAPKKWDKDFVEFKGETSHLHD